MVCTRITFCAKDLCVKKTLQCHLKVIINIHGVSQSAAVSASFLCFLAGKLRLDSFNWVKNGAGENCKSSLIDYLK